MPTISSFFGIVILMFMHDGDRRHKPHVHIRYGEYKASFSFKGELLAGELPIKQTRLVKEWISLNLVQLKKNWKLSNSTGKVIQIPPLIRR